MNLANAIIAQMMIPIDDFERGVSALKEKGVQFRTAPHLVNRSPKSELWLSEFTDPDGNQLALTAELALAGA